MRKFLIEFVLIVILLIVCIITAVTATNAKNKCEAFDEWIGGQPFDYRVDANGNSNLPSDAEITVTLTNPNSGLWRYYSESNDKSYVIVFLSFDANGPPFGQHDICTYQLDGLGMY